MRQPLLGESSAVPRPLGAVLDRAAARATFQARLARASWIALAAALAVELGAIGERGLAHATAAGAVLGSGLLLAAALALVAGKRAARSETARRLDAALGTGSLLETAAEALEGRHGAFARVLGSDAERALLARDVRKLVPIEPPRALGAGAAAALLLLALVLGPAAEAPAEELRPRELEVAVGDGQGTAPAKKGPKVLVPVAGSKGTKADPALAHDLRELAKVLSARPSAVTGDEEPIASALERALARGDLEAARAAMNALASAGTSRSVDRVGKAADTLTGRRGTEDGTGTGAGAGTGAATGTGAGAGTGAGSDPGRAATDEIPWRVLQAESRYRALIE